MVDALWFDSPWWDQTYLSHSTHHHRSWIQNLCQGSRRGRSARTFATSANSRNHEVLLVYWCGFGHGEPSHFADASEAEQSKLSWNAPITSTRGSNARTIRSSTNSWRHFLGHGGQGGTTGMINGEDI